MKQITLYLDKLTDTPPTYDELMRGFVELRQMHNEKARKLKDLSRELGSTKEKLTKANAELLKIKLGVHRGGSGNPFGSMF